MNLRHVDLASIHDAPRNANRMSPEKYAQLVESIKRIGFVVPIVLRDDEGKLEVVDGHHRKRAMVEIGTSSTIPAVVLEAGEDPRLAALALNRLRGETDLAVASILIDEMLADGLDLTDLSISGFSERELADLIEALNQDELSLDDVSGTEPPLEVGTPVDRPFLLELTFRSKEELATARKALRKACGKGGDLADGLLRIVSAE